MALVVGASARADLAATADAGIGYSDNIGRTATNENDETIGTVGLELDWAERTRRIRGNALVDVSYYDYLDDTFDSEVLGTADGTLAIGIVPENFEWVFEDSFGQAQSDPFAAASPANREDLNYFSTGPDLTANFGASNFGRIFGRWSTTTYEDSPLDAERTTGGIALGHRPSTRSEFTLNAVTEKVDFDDEANTDFDRDSVFLGWTLDASRTAIDAQLGYTWLERDGANDKTGSALVNIVITRTISAASTVALTLGQQLGDAGDSLRTQLQGNVVGGGGQQITATSDPFENRLASIEWRYNLGRTGFALGASYNDEDYETVGSLDRTRYIYNARFSRRLASALDFDLLGSYEKEDFDTRGLESEEVRFGASLNWRAWRTMGLRFTAERADRDTSNGQGEYQENRAFLTLAYYMGSDSARRR